MSHILVIDDEDLALQTICAILEPQGHEIVVAKNGVEGIEKYREEAFDLVITDIVMPEKEGMETIIEIRKKKPDQKIIAITGGGRNMSMDYLKTAKIFGADETLAKPFTPIELRAAVDHCLTR